MDKKREIWMDFMRVTACFMVMAVHSAEPFYLGGEGSLVASATDAYWVALFEGLCRCCVPLFVLSSSYLLFPLKCDSAEFFRKRAIRIVIPLVLWSLVYAFCFGEPVANLKGLLLNFNYAAGHLWFVYMLVGLYLVMPLLSPWAEKVSKKELEVYLLIWAITTMVPFIRDAAGGPAPLIKAADGLPAPALFPLWGEAAWNPFGALYYVSGFLGYLLAGLYVKKFVPVGRLTRVLGWSLFLVGFLASAFGMLLRIGASSDTYPISGPVDLAVVWEIPLMFCGSPVVLSAIGLLLVFKNTEFREGGFYKHIILPLSKAGYGMYLTHILVLGVFSALYREIIGSTPLSILATAVSTFITVGLACVLIRKIPRLGQYLF